VALQNTNGASSNAGALVSRRKRPKSKRSGRQTLAEAVAEKDAAKNPSAAAAPRTPRSAAPSRPTYKKGATCKTGDAKAECPAGAGGPPQRIESGTLGSWSGPERGLPERGFPKRLKAGPQGGVPKDARHGGPTSRGTNVTGDQRLGRPQTRETDVTVDPVYRDPVDGGPAHLEGPTSFVQGPGVEEPWYGHPLVLMRPRPSRRRHSKSLGGKLAMEARSRRSRPERSRRAALGRAALASRRMKCAETHEST
jgi:hypothetical protein